MSKLPNISRSISEFPNASISKFLNLATQILPNFQTQGLHLTEYKSILQCIRAIEYTDTCLSCIWDSSERRTGSKHNLADLSRNLIPWSNAPVCSPEARIYLLPRRRRSPPKKSVNSVRKIVSRSRQSVEE